MQEFCLYWMIWPLAKHPDSFSSQLTYFCTQRASLLLKPCSAIALASGFPESVVGVCTPLSPLIGLIFKFLFYHFRHQSNLLVTTASRNCIIWIIWFYNDTKMINWRPDGLLHWRNPLSGIYYMCNCKHDGLLLSYKPGSLFNYPSGWIKGLTREQIMLKENNGNQIDSYKPDNWMVFLIYGLLRLIKS